MFLYTIYDSRAEEFGEIFEAKSNDVAVRKFRILVEPLPFREEYSLYLVGHWDRVEGILAYNELEEGKKTHIPIEFAPREGRNAL